jgi:hypothetical protein
MAEDPSSKVHFSNLGLLMQYEEEINTVEARSMGKPPGTLPSGTYAGLVSYYAGAGT